MEDPGPWRLRRWAHIAPWLADDIHSALRHPPTSAGTCIPSSRPRSRARLQYVNSCIPMATRPRSRLCKGVAWLRFTIVSVFSNSLINDMALLS